MTILFSRPFSPKRRSVLSRSAAPLLALALAFSAALPLAAQTAPASVSPRDAAKPAPSLAYDVAVIRPSHATNLDSGIGTDNEILTATNVTVVRLMQFACDIRHRLISGLPSWAEHDRFDVSAKILDASPEQIKDLTQDQTRTLLRGLLEQRFGFKYHDATEVVPDYELTVVKSGAKLTPTKRATNDDSVSVNNNTEVIADGISMVHLATLLSDLVDRSVVDRTGLAGRFDLRLRWSREDAKADAANNGSTADAPPPIFTAIEEQLGLRLVPGKDAVRELVVDQLTPPSDN